MFLFKLITTLRKLNAGILINERFMKLTKWFVFLFHLPGFFIIEIDLDMIFSVSSMIIGVFHYLSIEYLTSKSHLKKSRPAERVYILRAIFGMLQKNLSWIERMTEFTLTWDTMFEAFFVNFNFIIFWIEVIESLFLLGNSICQLLIGLPLLTKLLVFISI